MRDLDEYLMSRFRNGDDEAFDQLVERHQGPLLQFACRYVGRRELAEEVVQESFVKVLRSASSYRSDVASFRTWLYTIAHRTAIDVLRKSKREVLSRNIEDSEGFPSDMDSVPDTRPGPVSRTLSREIAERVEQAVRNLGEGNRSVFVLRAFSGLSYEEIGSVLGCPTGTAKSRMYNALRSLRDQLADLGVVTGVREPDPQESGGG